jgi:hypothetical protein
MEGVVTVFGSGALIAVGSRSVEGAKRDLTIAYSTILSALRAVAQGFRAAREESFKAEGVCVAREAH